MAVVSVGDVLGQALRVDAVLGRGGGGTVFLATDLWLGRKVAVKVLADPVARSPELIELFKNEAQALTRVRSDRVAQAYAMGPHADSCWLAMEYVDGSSLAAIIRDHAANRALVPLQRALSILREVATGLAAVHRAKLVHRDVKPANIVVETHTGRPVLVDFGLAVADGHRVKGPAIAGTASYMAPEQSFGEDVSAQTDIYALGVTAFELLTGELPYRGETMMEVLVKHALEELPRVSTHRPEIAVFDDVIGHALAKRPEDRYPSCDAFVAAIDRALRSFDTRPTVPPLASVESPPPLAAAVRILVVDDDPAFRRFAMRLLEARFTGDKTRIQLLEAASGQAALSIAYACAPDLVLLDFDMPGLDGIATLTELRRLPRGNDARVVVVSSSVGENERWRFEVLGVTDFLKKPISGGALVATLARIVGEVR